MGVIKQKLPLLAPIKVVKRLTEEVEGEFKEAGLSTEQIAIIINKVVAIAKVGMGGEFTVMGGYSAEEQLFHNSREMLYELDEQEKLLDFLNEAEPSESDLEDAYSAADSIAFTGTEKQISWAKDVATSSSDAIARAWKKKTIALPTSASWWIDNRSDIYTALMKLEK